MPVVTSEIATADCVPELTFDARAFVADSADELLVLILEAIGWVWLA
jgi:hypothetical protein